MHHGAARERLDPARQPGRRNRLRRLVGHEGELAARRRLRRGLGRLRAGARPRPAGQSRLDTDQPGHALEVEAVAAARVRLERRVAQPRHRQRDRCAERREVRPVVGGGGAVDHGVEAVVAPRPERI